MKADSLADLVNMAATLHLPAPQKPGSKIEGDRQTPPANILSLNRGHPK
jgi:hypothetical protein